MRPAVWLRASALLGALALSPACRAIDTSEELQSLACELPAERAGPPAAAAPPPAAPQPAAAPPAARDGLDDFPLAGSVFPGLGGRLHSSLCDPASDPYGSCL